MKKKIKKIIKKILKKLGLFETIKKKYNSNDCKIFRRNKKLNGLFYAIRSYKKVKDYNYFKNLNKRHYKKELKEWYFKNTNEVLDLKNPQNFNQKIQYLKMYDCTKMKTLLTDKYENREWIKKHIGEEYLVNLLGVYDNFSDIDFDKLPNQFVIKCNHGSRFNYIVKDKSKLDIKDLETKVNKWMNTNFAYNSSFEMQYELIKPKILCEEYLGDNLIDLQAWCSYGDILFFSYIHSPHGENKKATFDEKWNKLDFYTSKPIYEGEVKKPKDLLAMRKIAKKVSKKFKFVRVDFYITKDNKLLISEFTFTPASGAISWYPAKMNKIIGDKIDLSK